MTYRRADIRIYAGESEHLLVECGGTGLRASFDLRESVTGNATPSVLKIYNMSDATAGRIDAGEDVEVSAGYDDTDLQLIYRGRIQQFEQRHESADTILEIEMTSGDLGAEVQVRAARGDVPVRDVVRDIAAFAGVGMGTSTSLIDARSVLTDYSYDGGIRDALTEILGQFNLSWHVSFGVLHLSRGGESPTSYAVPISEGTGMIASPSRTDEGYVVRTLISSRLLLGGHANVTSTRVDLQDSGIVEGTPGVYQIDKLRHRGDTWSGDWFTEATLRSPGP